MSFDFREWYEDAHRLLGIIRQAGGWFHCCTNTTISINDDPDPETIRQRFADHDIKAQAKAQGILREVQLIREAQAKLKLELGSLWLLLEPAYFDLRDIDAEGLGGFRCAGLALLELTDRVKGWGGDLWAIAHRERRGLNVGEWADWSGRERWLGEVVDTIQARLLLEKSWLLKHTHPPLVMSQAESNAPPSPPTPRPRGRGGRPAKGRGELTDNQEKLAAAIRHWHGFQVETLSCTNCDPISSKKLASKAGVSKGKTTTKFFAWWFPSGGNKEYQKLCRGGDPKALAVEIARLSREGLQTVLEYKDQVFSEYKKRRDNDD